MAGGPGNVSCTNSIYTPGVSMHVFPKNEKARNGCALLEDIETVSF